VALDYEKLRATVAYARDRGWAVDPLHVARGSCSLCRRIATDEEFFERDKDEEEDDREIARCLWASKSSEYEGRGENALDDEESAEFDMKYWAAEFYGDKIRWEDGVPSSRFFAGVSSRWFRFDVWEIEELKEKLWNRLRCAWE